MSGPGCTPVCPKIAGIPEDKCRITGDRKWMDMGLESNPFTTWFAAISCARWASGDSRQVVTSHGSSLWLAVQLRAEAVLSPSVQMKRPHAKAPHFSLAVTQLLQSSSQGDYCVLPMPKNISIHLWMYLDNEILFASCDHHEHHHINWYKLLPVRGDFHNQRFPFSREMRNEKERDS